MCYVRVTAKPLTAITSSMDIGAGRGAAKKVLRLHIGILEIRDIDDAVSGEMCRDRRQRKVRQAEYLRNGQAIR